MIKESKSLVKKAAKIAGVTCVAAGAVALVTTGAALKALTVGAKYLKSRVQKIIGDSTEAEVVIDAEPATEELTVAESEKTTSGAED